jgi:hypothetical protein
MEELVVNLDQYQKISKSGKIFNTLLGTGMILLSARVIVNRIAEGQGFWEYFFFILVFIFGINMILFTYGVFFRIKRRYMVLSRNNGVEYKLSYFYPSRTIHWEDIEKVDIKTLKIHFHEGRGSVTRLKLGEISFNDIKKIKQTLADYCTEKEIPWTDTTVESDVA